MKRFEQFCCDVDKFIAVFDFAGNNAKLLMDIKSDIEEANRLYGRYGRSYDEQENARMELISKQSNLLKKLNDIMGKDNRKTESLIGATMIADLLRAFRLHASLLEDVWCAVSPYHNGIISDESMRKLRSVFEFDDGE